MPTPTLETSKAAALAGQAFYEAGQGRGFRDAEGGTTWEPVKLAKGMRYDQVLGEEDLISPPRSLSPRQQRRAQGARAHPVSQEDMARYTTLPRRDRFSPILTREEVQDQRALLGEAAATFDNQQDGEERGEEESKRTAWIPPRRRLVS